MQLHGFSFDNISSFSIFHPNPDKPEPNKIYITKTRKYENTKKQM